MHLLLVVAEVPSEIRGLLTRLRLLLRRPDKDSRQRRVCDIRFEVTALRQQFGTLLCGCRETTHSRSEPRIVIGNACRN